ncbi:MAG: alpha/beta hydrolase [Planctomycetota bacterium]|nr:alpha/beta hydrolase [Planctomycetota bacterium]
MEVPLNRVFRSMLVWCALTSVSLADEAAKHTETEYAVHVLNDIAYRSGLDQSEYETQRCRLDVYLPKGKKNFATLIWFHGGGLKNGDKSRLLPNDSVKTALIAESLARSGIAVIATNYRLSPLVTFPAYIQDGAKAVSWAKNNMGSHGADTNRCFIGGHSAGAYLALMLAMDTSYLEAEGVKSIDIAGIVSVSSQTMTHYTVREEQGIGKHTITADKASPIYFARKSAPPILLLYADKDSPARAEENALFFAVMKDAGNKKISSLEIKDRNHGTIASEIVEPSDPARKAILDFIKKPNE